tara:strand:- start:2778 stop:3305 length:528 start_codon:yes stop_codon:yes gene_type:complete
VEYKIRGEDLFVADTAIIKHPNRIELGHHVAIDHFVYFSTSGVIGDYVHIAPSVTIIGGIDSMLFMEDFSGVAANSTIICSSDDFTKGMMNPQIPIKYRNTKIGEVIIKRFACVGVNCVVMPSITLGEGSVIGAGSVVTKDTKPWGIYIGSPAKLVGMRDKKSVILGAKKLGYEF